MGDGISKYTLPCNAPEAPMQWMEKYLPVITSSDSCEGAADDWLGVDNDCVCSTANETLETVAQGRVQLYGDRGFGLHLVNTSFKLTSGGLSVAAVEAVFEERRNRFFVLLSNNTMLVKENLRVWNGGIPPETLDAATFRDVATRLLSLAATKAEIQEIFDSLDNKLSASRGGAGRRR